jgi:putative SOS response-associated peptidase YedK
MCGRFALHHSAQQLAGHFAVEQLAIDFQPRYNVAPTQAVAVVVQQEQRALDAFRWGLVPFWAKDAKIGSRMINARSETIAEKPAFRNAFKRRRCLIPASGYYEWKKEGNRKVPHYLYLEGGRPLALAGLWEEWNSPEGETLRTCAIVTTQANDFAAAIHHRMPVILEGEGQEAWLDPSRENAAELTALLQPYSGDDLAAHPVSTRVNPPTFDDPACIEPVT